MKIILDTESVEVNFLTNIICIATKFAKQIEGHDCK